MNCPTCNKPMHTRTRTLFVEVESKKWVYECEEMVCEDHPQDAWQTGEQLDKELEAIKAAKAAAAKLKKHTP